MAQSKSQSISTSGGYMNGRYPTWKGIVTIALACMGIVAATTTWAWSLHISRPHNGAATKSELLEVKKDMGEDIGRIEVRQIRIEDKIDSIKVEIMKRP